MELNYFPFLSTQFFDFIKKKKVLYKLIQNTFRMKFISVE